MCTSRSRSEHHEANGVDKRNRLLNVGPSVSSDSVVSSKQTGRCECQLLLHACQCIQGGPWGRHVSATALLIGLDTIWQSQVSVGTKGEMAVERVLLRMIRSSYNNGPWRGWGTVDSGLDSSSTSCTICPVRPVEHAQHRQQTHGHNTAEQ